MLVQKLAPVVTIVLLLLALSAQAEEYQGRVVKVEKDKLTLAVTWRGDLKKGVRVDPAVTTEFTLAPKLKILNFRAEEVKDQETKQRILRVGEYVIVKTEKKDKQETATSIQTLPGAGPGGCSERGLADGLRSNSTLHLAAVEWIGKAVGSR